MKIKIVEFVSVTKFYGTVHWLLNCFVPTDRETAIFIGLLQGCECVENKLFTVQ
jgi:hypothetical protein